MSVAEVKVCEIRINHDKTKEVLFNGRNLYFTPRLSLQGDEQLDLVEQVRLLCVEVSCRENTSAICQKAYPRMGMLRRLKRLGFF